MLSDNRSEKAILVVDMINEFAHNQGNFFVPSSREIIPYILGELQYFRERNRPVIFCNTVWEKEKAYSSAVIQDLSPRTKELCINKIRPNAFFKTELKSILEQLKVKNLIIVGVPFHTSVLLTAAAAMDHGFLVVVPETCVGSAHEQEYMSALQIINRWQSCEQMKII
ncbi:MAG: cysteine hydrolase [Myxococcales bacterium]|nr:cysteine hydrolase [Myxococcales bacterium]USN51782.1 MAG: cysteine hydrolase [Myxococcales bacterium]